MAHVYEVKTSDGQTYTVTTREYHEDHHDTTFRDHLIEVIKTTFSSVASAVLVHHYTYRGPK